jgi:negative regulator of replication initiation
MPNTYTKLTLKSFKEKLGAGGYASLVGAKRAIGKTQDLAEKDKNKARKLAEEHFAAGGKAAPAKKLPAKKSPKKKAKKKAAKKKAAKAKVAKAAPKKKAPAKKKKKAKAKTKGKPAPKPAPVRTPRNTTTNVDQMTAAEIRKHPMAAVQVAQSAIGSVSDALTAMKAAGVLDDPRYKEEAVKGVQTLGKAVKLIDQAVVTPLTGSNNGRTPVASMSPEESKAAKLFQETKPGAIGQQPLQVSGTPSEETPPVAVTDVDPKPANN